MNPIIASLIKDGIAVELSSRDGLLRYDLQTGMKSGCTIVEQQDGKLIAEMRYGKSESIESVEEVVAAVLSCKHGREYMSCAWGSYFEKHGISLEGF